MKIKIFNNIFSSNRHFDENGFLRVSNNLILPIGIMEYYGSELNEYLPNLNLDDDKIYKLNISEEEAIKCLEKWKGIPIREEHEWTTSENVKGSQIGTIGEDIKIVEEDGKKYMSANLFINDKEAIDKITSGTKDELSTSYEHKIKKAENKEYDFEVYDIQPNHLALVEQGRGGDKVRVANENTISDNSCFTNNINNQKEKKMENEIKLSIDGKEVDLSKFITEEQAEGEHDESITDNANEVDNVCKNEDKRAIIDEIGGMLKDKIDEELWRTIIGKLEKISYEPSEGETKSDNEDKDEGGDKKEEKDDKAKAMNYDAIYSKVYKSVLNSLKQENENRVKAYNSVKAISGDFDYSNKSELEIYNAGLSSIGLSAENVIEAKAMIKAYNSTMSSSNDVVNTKNANDKFIFNF